MNLNSEQRKSAFVQLGRTLGSIASEQSWPGFACGLTREEYGDVLETIDRHYITNGWFTRENVMKAVRAWSEALTQEQIDAWLARYDAEKPAQASKNIGIICAGNIPLVGLHDLICVLITGNKAIIKLSAADNQLIPAVCKILTALEPEFANHIVFAEKLTEYDAVIATGSNNTSRYFEYYFGKVPNIIRKSRTSVAILTGDETKAELEQLAHDIFDYFGLGCRNVSKIFIPKGYDLNKLFDAIYPFNPIINHNKYANNYDYNKAVWLLNREDLLDNGFILLKQDERYASPTASLFYEYYDNLSQVKDKISRDADEIQCVVGAGYIPPGSAQSPQLWDYADGVDTIAFLHSLRG